MLAVQPSTSNSDDVCTGTHSAVLTQFELNPLLRGGDAVRVENLSAQSEYQRKKMDYTRHKREQQEREKMQMRFRSKAETHLRVVPIQGDGRCLFRALVSSQAGPQPCAAMNTISMLTSPLTTACVSTCVRIHSLTGLLLLLQAKGLAHAKGQFVGGEAEEKDADELRMAVSDALCRSPQRLKSFSEVLPSIESIEGGLRK